jgi:hypothetical protein
MEIADDEEEFSDDEDNVHIFNLKNHVTSHSLQEFIYFKVMKASCNDSKCDLMWLDKVTMLHPIINFSKNITSVTQLGAVNCRIPSLPSDLPAGYLNLRFISHLQACISPHLRFSPCYRPAFTHSLHL